MIPSRFRQSMSSISSTSLPDVSKAVGSALLTLGAGLLLAAAPVHAAQQAEASLPASAALSPGAPGWTDWADLALASPIVLVATITHIDRLSARDSPGLRPGEARVLVHARLDHVLKAARIMPAEAAWFWQGRLDANGRIPFARQDRVLVFARPLSGGARPEVQPLQLISANGQQPHDAQAMDWLRAILQEAQRSESVPAMVSGIETAFRTVGDLPGESESQFFLTTRSGRPLTLIIRRRADQPAEVVASAGELLEQAQAVRPRSLLWRALACGLPAALPEEHADQEALVADYQLARERIGSCDRRLVPPR